MKQIITFLFIGFYTLTSAQPNVNQIKALQTNTNSYKVFVTEPLDSTTTEKFILEIGTDTWETRYTTSTDLVKERNLEGYIQSNKSNTITVQVAPSSTKLIPRKNVPREYCNRADYYQFTEKNGLYLAVVEIPARYQTLEIISILENGVPKNIVKSEKIAIRKLVRKGSIRIVPAEGYIKSDNYDSYEVYGGKWSEMKQHLGNPCFKYYQNNKTYQIQRKLVELGYEIEVDGVLGSHTRDAIIDYQRKNNLPEGRLDIETLKHLGVSH